MYSCISCGHIEIIKVYMGQNLSCVQVTGNKGFTTGGLMYHIYKCLHTCITNEKLARMYNYMHALVAPSSCILSNTSAQIKHNPNIFPPYVTNLT